MRYRIFRRTNHSRVECDCGFKETVPDAVAEQTARYHTHLTPAQPSRGSRTSNGRRD